MLFLSSTFAFLDHNCYFNRSASLKRILSVADKIHAKESWMKRHVIFALVASVAIIILALIIIATRSHSQGQSNTYLGGAGWTLKQNVMLKLPGEEPRLIGLREKHFAADGLRKDIDYGIDNNNGKARRRSVIIYDPSRGVFAQNFIYSRLFYLGECAPLGKDVLGKDVDVYQVRSNSNYIGDEQILGYDCAVTRNIYPNGMITESYIAYRLGGFAIKEVDQNDLRTTVWEPTAIEIGNVQESVVAYPTDWEVDFSDVEDDIQRLSANPNDSNNARVDRLRRQLLYAKKRLGLQK